VCEVQIDVSHAELNIKLRDLLAKEQQVLDHKQLTIQRTRLLRHQAPSSLQTINSAVATARNA
jgi:hypothetical protein